MSTEKARGGFGDLLQRLLRIARRAGNGAKDFGAGVLPFQCRLGFVEQSRILNGDRSLIGKALLQRQLFVGEWREPVAVDDQCADRLALAPQRRAGHRPGAGGARIGQARPVGNRGIDIVEIGHVDLAVLGDDRARHVPAADPQLCFRDACADPFRAVTDPYDLGPAIALGDLDGGAGRAKQAHGGLGDLVERAISIARSAGDGAQDVGAGVLAIPRHAQFGLQPGVFSA